MSHMSHPDNSIVEETNGVQDDHVASHETGSGSSDSSSSNSSFKLINNNNSTSKSRSRNQNRTSDPSSSGRTTVDNGKTRELKRELRTNLLKSSRFKPKFVDGQDGDGAELDATIHRTCTNGKESSTSTSRDNSLPPPMDRVTGVAAATAASPSKDCDQVAPLSSSSSISTTTTTIFPGESQLWPIKEEAVEEGTAAAAGSDNNDLGNDGQRPGRGAGVSEPSEPKRDHDKVNDDQGSSIPGAAVREESRALLSADATTSTSEIKCSSLKAESNSMPSSRDPHHVPVTCTPMSSSSSSSYSNNKRQTCETTTSQSSHAKQGKVAGKKSSFNVKIQCKLDHHIASRLESNDLSAEIGHSLKIPRLLLPSADPHISGLRFGRFFRSEVHANGGGRILRLYQDDIAHIQVSVYCLRVLLRIEGLTFVFHFCLLSCKNKRIQLLVKNWHWNS